MTTIGEISANDAVSNYTRILERAQNPTSSTVSEIDTELVRMQAELAADQAVATRALSAGDTDTATEAAVEMQVDRYVIRRLQDLKQNLLGSTPPANTNTTGVSLRNTTPVVAPTPAPVVTPVAEPVVTRLSAAHVEELGKTLRSAIRSASADSIFDHVGAHVTGNSVVLTGYVHSDRTAENLVEKLNEKLRDKARDGKLPSLTISADSLGVGSDNMRARGIKTAIVSHFYRQGFQLRHEDLRAAGSFGSLPFRSPMGELSGHPRSFGLFVDDSGHVTVTGEVRFAARWPFMLRDAARREFLRGVTMATN